MSILDLVDNQNGTFYDDNYNRCSVLDELGKQYLLVRNFNTPSAEIVPIMVDDGHGNTSFQTFNLDGQTKPIVDAGTGTQVSLYNNSGTLKVFGDNTIKVVDPATLLPINNTLPTQYLDYAIHWNSMTAEQKIARQNQPGFQKDANAKGATVTPDYKSTRTKKKAQSKKFTFNFSTKSSALHLKAVRLLEQNPDGSLSYINDTGNDYSAGSTSLVSAPIGSLYSGNDGFYFSSHQDTGIRKHSVTINYPNVTTVSAIEIAVNGNGMATPDNLAVTFTCVDGKEYQAARITGFTFNPENGETLVLRLPLHDAYSDTIDIGPDITTYNEQTEIKAKITAGNPLTLQEFMTLWLPRSDAVDLVNGIKAGKSAKDITTVNKAITTRYYNMAVGATLVNH